MPTRIKIFACDPAPVVTGASVGATVSVSFSYSISATNSPESYSASGLPPGLSVNTGTGAITGTPTTAGVYSATIGAANCCGSDTDTLTITVSCPVPNLTSATTASGTVGTPFSFTLTATNSPTSFSASGLPPGLSINTGTGAITGTPTTPGIYSVTTGASNACGSDSDSLTITIAPDECAMPELVCDSISYTESKCGFPEQSGYESSPPKFYREQTWSGTLTVEQWDAPDCDLGIGFRTEFSEYIFSGTSFVSESDCSITPGNLLEQPDGDITPIPVEPMSNFVNGVNTNSQPAVITSTTYTITNDGVCYPSGGESFKKSGEAVETLSDEFSTAELLSRVDGALDFISYPGTWAGDCFALRDLTDDEVTYTIQRFKYKFILPDLTGYSSYTINWVERFTPEGGGSPTDTPRSYTWNGTDTETSVRTVLEPVADGIIEIVDIEVECS